MRTEDIVATVLLLWGQLSDAQAKATMLAGPTPPSVSDFADWWRMRLPHAGYPGESLWRKAEDLIGDHERRDVSVIGLSSGLYPNFLRLISDPPPVLFCRGPHIWTEHRRGVAIVGTREASDAGLEIARRIAKYVGDHGYTVVSGLALGIDAAAHEGSLISTSPTIAVLAHGLHEATPRKNARLADRILERGGAWISEHPLGTQPRPANFVLRNRIQIGLSVGSIIVEAAARSGSMAQAQYCVKERRPLFAVVPETSENRLGLKSEGTREMTSRLKAAPVRTKVDYPTVLDALSASFEELDEHSATLGSA